MDRAGQRSITPGHGCVHGHEADRRVPQGGSDDRLHRRALHHGSVRAALAVEWVNPKQVVPMHFGTYGILKGTPAQLKEAIEKRKLAPKWWR